MSREFSIRSTGTQSDAALRPRLLLRGSMLPYFAAAAILLLAVMIALGPLKIGRGATATPAPLLLKLLLGGSFAAVAVAIVRLSGPTVFDRRDGTVSMPRRMPWHAARRSVSVAGCTAVRIDHVWRYTHKLNQVTRKRVRTKPRKLYQVRVMEGERELVLLTERSSYPRCRGVAERVAEFLNVRLVDGSEPGSSTRQPHELNLAYVERVRPTPVNELAGLQRTIEDRILVTTVEDATKFILPPDRSEQRYVGLLTWVPGAAMSLVVAFQLGSFWSLEASIAAPIALAGGLILALLAFSNPRTIIRASPDELRVSTRWRGASWTTRMPAARMEELELLGNQIVARSDRNVLRFGRALGPHSRAWLRSAITAAMLGREVPPAKLA